MKIKKLFGIKGPSQEFIKSPQLDRSGKNMVLKYDYETETGEEKLAGIVFSDVVSCKITKEICVETHFIEAYDTVCIVKDSSWIMEIENSYQGEKPFDFFHYVIYFEDYGSYEFIAKGAFEKK